MCGKGKGLQNWTHPGLRIGDVFLKVAVGAGRGAGFWGFVEPVCQDKSQEERTTGSCCLHREGDHAPCVLVGFCVKPYAWLGG